MFGFQRAEYYIYVQPICLCSIAKDELPVLQNLGFHRFPLNLEYTFELGVYLIVVTYDKAMNWHQHPLPLDFGMLLLRP